MVTNLTSDQVLQLELLKKLSVGSQYPRVLHPHINQLQILNIVHDLWLVESAEPVEIDGGLRDLNSGNFGMKAKMRVSWNLSLATDTEG